MQVEDDQEDADEDHASGNEDEPHGRSGVDEDADFPVEAGAGSRVDHQLRVGNDGTPNVAPVDRARDGDFEVLNVVVDLAEAEVDEGQTKTVGSAVELLAA